MKAWYNFYENEKGFVIERQRFEVFVKTLPFLDITLEKSKVAYQHLARRYLVFVADSWLWDAKAKRVGRLAIPVFSRIVAGVDPIMKRFFPDLTDEEREEFNEKVRQDIKNPLYHLYRDMFPHLDPIANVRCFIIARKPEGSF
jgi:hypothetical protein